MAASTTPQHHHVAEDENENEEELTNGDASGDVSRDLDTDEHIKDPIEDRRTLAERNERLHDQLNVSTIANQFCQDFYIRTLVCCLLFVGFEERFGTISRREQGNTK